MNFLLAIIAGAIQGLTEFLPVSSTAHLIIYENILGISQKTFGLAFDASVHLGTFFAVLIFFHKDYLKIFNLKNKLLSLLFFGTIPAVIFGLLLEEQIESSFRQIWVVASALIIFSAVIIVSELIGKKVKKQRDLKIHQALLIGLFQALALIPGISRSGSTISAGLILGLTREESARFAFILSGPIIIGAGLKKILEVSYGNLIPSDYNFFIAGIISSAIFGFITIKYFLKFLQSNSLIPFAYYRVALGLLLLLAIFVS